MHPEIRTGMLEFLGSPWARAVMLFAAIAMLIVVGLYIASKFRGTEDDNTIPANEMLTNFREMHSKGELSDEEFRTIKAKLAVELRKQLNDSDKQG